MPRAARVQAVAPLRRRRRAAAPARRSTGSRAWMYLRAVAEALLHVDREAARRRRRRPRRSCGCAAACAARCRAGRSARRRQLPRQRIAGRGRASMRRCRASGDCDEARRRRQHRWPTAAPRASRLPTTRNGSCAKKLAVLIGHVVAHHARPELCHALAHAARAPASRARRRGRGARSCHAASPMRGGARMRHEARQRLDARQPGAHVRIGLQRDVAFRRMRPCSCSCAMSARSAPRPPGTARRAARAPSRAAARARARSPRRGSAARRTARSTRATRRAAGERAGGDRQPALHLRRARPDRAAASAPLGVVALVEVDQDRVRVAPASTSPSSITGTWPKGLHRRKSGVLVRRPRADRPRSSRRAGRAARGTAAPGASGRKSASCGP